MGVCYIHLVFFPSTVFCSSSGLTVGVGALGSAALGLKRSANGFAGSGKGLAWIWPSTWILNRTLSQIPNGNNTAE